MKNIEIIDDVVTTEATRKNVKLILPVLIDWAMKGFKSKTYGELIHAIGKTQYTGIGYALYAVQNVINELSERTGVEIPTLNCLCKNSKTKLPSEGFDYVSPHYNDLDEEGKLIFVEGLDSKACSFEHWKWVLKELGLTAFRAFTGEELNFVEEMKNHASGGEGEEHRLLKEYIYQHPESIGYKEVQLADMEHILPSGDRLDVYLELDDGTHVAIEVKPRTAPEADIIRGSFQCLKYDTILKAIRKLENANYNIETILVTPQIFGDLSKRVADELGVFYIDAFNFPVE